MNRQTALKYREFIEKAAAALSDTEAITVPELFPRWKTDTEMVAGNRVFYNSVLYSILQTHISQDDWTPDVAVSLFAKVLIPDPEVIPEWEQPDSTNPYKKGDKVKHNGKTWESNIDGNVWEPGVYGWTAVE